MKATNTLAAAGAGKARKPYIIRQHLAEMGMTMQAVADQIGVSGELVRDTIRGARNNARVLRALYEMGIPESALSLPKRVREELNQQPVAA